METIEIKVTIKEEVKKTKVYDFSESIKALEKVQEMSAAIITETNDAICSVGMQSFEKWIERLHTELKPILNNHGVMQLINKNLWFGYARFETAINGPDKDEFVLKLYRGNCPNMTIRLLPTRYEIDSFGFDPETDLRTFSANAEFVHKTIMDTVTYAIRDAKEKAERRAKERVQTLENLLNM